MSLPKISGVFCPSCQQIWLEITHDPETATFHTDCACGFELSHPEVEKLIFILDKIENSYTEGYEKGIEQRRKDTLHRKSVLAQEIFIQSVSKIPVVDKELNFIKRLAKSCFLAAHIYITEMDKAGPPKE